MTRFDKTISHHLLTCSLAVCVPRSSLDFWASLSQSRRRSMSFACLAKWRAKMFSQCRFFCIPFALESIHSSRFRSSRRSSAMRFLPSLCEDVSILFPAGAVRSTAASFARLHGETSEKLSKTLFRWVTRWVTDDLPLSRGKEVWMS